MSVERWGDKGTARDPEAAFPPVPHPCSSRVCRERFLLKNH